MSTDATDATDANDGSPPDAAAPDGDAAEAMDPLQLALDAANGEVQKLRAELDERTGRLRQVSKGYTELQAEMGAFRERLEAQGKLARARREEEVVRTFFDPVQNLKRSLEAGIADADSFLEGIRIIVHQCEEGLRRLGLEPIPGVGADFDPNLHEALALMPVSDPAQDGKVLLVHLDGYMVGGRPVQVAQVVVGKHTAEAGEA